MIGRNLISILCLALYSVSWSQISSQKEEIRAYDSTGSKDYSLYPWWIEMMDDSSANYFEVQKAFDAYWEGKIIPVREENEVRPIHDPAKQELPIIDTRYVAEVKTYKAWLRYYKYLHEEDGTIFPPSRIMAEWERQMKERGKQ